MDDYFLEFEDRRPPPPLPYSRLRESLWQFLATIALVIGAWYIWWRWTNSLNADAMWFALPLVLAETFAYFGMLLFVFNLWRDQAPNLIAAPAIIEDVYPESPDKGRLITVDVMFATYDEDPELVRLGILDAKKMKYPHPIDIKIHILDDGRRTEMGTVCKQEGVNHITREGNEGFKAGNLRNALEQTSGDFLVICDADTRPFPTMLENTLGYFRDPKMAWVQTPQWFYDIPDGVSLDAFLRKRFGENMSKFGGFLERFFGPIKIGQDPFVNDPKMFYDIILRRRNRVNAAFCCGAGSIHRRESVMEAALRGFGTKVEQRVFAAEEDITISSKERTVAPALMEAIRTQAATAEVLTPYRYHVSEDIFTSIVLHSDHKRGWKSMQHPFVESKMLSPQDLLTWTIQRYKYAGGSLDIMVHDNPIFRRGLTLSQRLMYGMTFYSYLAPIWNMVFLFAPIIYLLTGISPVSSYSDEFFLHLIPFLITLELAIMVGTWGIAGYSAKASYLSFFPIGFRAIWAVLRGEKISFPVTPKVRQTGNFLGLVKPQIAVVILTVFSAFWGVIALSIGNGLHSTTGVITNILWGLNNCLAMAGIIGSAMWQPPSSQKESKA